MREIGVIGVIGLIVIAGIVLYLAMAGLAIIYSLGASKSQKGRRLFFGILGVAMFYAFAYTCIHLYRYGCPL